MPARFRAVASGFGTTMLRWPPMHFAPVASEQKKPADFHRRAFLFDIAALKTGRRRF
jgi:hypothetical protein